MRCIQCALYDASFRGWLLRYVSYVACHKTMMVSSLFQARVQSPLSPQGKSFCCILCSFYSSFQQMLSKEAFLQNVSRVADVKLLALNKPLPEHPCAATSLFLSWCIQSHLLYTAIIQVRQVVCILIVAIATQQADVAREAFLQLCIVYLYVYEPHAMEVNVKTTAT